MKKAVLKLELDDDKTKKKAMKTVSSSGVDSISIDTKDKKLTVVGDIDPVDIVSKLRKLCHTEIITIGPAKEPEKKKEEPKKQEDHVAEFVEPYNTYNPHMTSDYYVVNVDDNPNFCVVS